jgi:hypothetical protein
MPKAETYWPQTPCWVCKAPFKRDEDMVMLRNNWYRHARCKLKGKPYGLPDSPNKVAG